MKLGVRVTLQILKKQSWSSADTLGIAALRYAIGDFGHFENWINFGLNTPQLAGPVERGNPLAEIVEGQRNSSLRERRL
jgi:hypothetical protein